MTLPPTLKTSWARKAWLWILGSAGGVSLLAVLFFFSPAQYPFYPRCLLNSLTGLQCPGCGGLRAVHQLLHGNFYEALALNPLFTLALPPLAGFLLWQLFSLATGRTPFNPFHRPRLVWLCVAAMIGFGIVRNLAFFKVLWMRLNASA